MDPEKRAEILALWAQMTQESHNATRSATREQPTGGRVSTVIENSTIIMCSGGTDADVLRALEELVDRLRHNRKAAAG